MSIKLQSASMARESTSFQANAILRSDVESTIMIQRGLPRERAWQSAGNGRGSWWNSGASHMNEAFPIRYFVITWGLFHCGIRGAVSYTRLEPPDTEPYVRWCGRTG